jgi:hypothetical protein
VQRVDLTALARSLNIREVFDSLGVPYKARLDGTELMLACINPDHQDKSGDSLQMNARGDQWNGLWKCNPCGWKGNIYKYLTGATEQNFGQVIEYLKSHGTVELIDDEARVTRDREAALALPDQQAETPIPGMQISYTPFQYKTSWDMRLPHEAEMARRGISTAVAFNHRVGWAENFLYKPDPQRPVYARNAIVFPIYYQGVLVSYFLRCWNGVFFGDIGKLFPPGAVIGQVPYNLDGCQSPNPTVVTEGIIDAQVVESAVRMYSLEYDSSCAYSTGISPWHIDKYGKLPGALVLMPDRDGEAGVQLCEGLAPPLYHHKDVYIANIPWGKDPADCTPMEIKKALDEKQLWISYTTENRILYGKPYIFCPGAV